MKNTFFQVVDKGFIWYARKNTRYKIASGPRCIVTDKGEVICSFMVQTALGVNNFRPVIVRSHNCRTWSGFTMPWMHLSSKYSIFGSISKSYDGQIFFFGARTVIDNPCELFWSETTQGMKENGLVYAYSSDEGYTWSELFEIPKPISGAAEAPGAMCITKNGSWHACYSPYNTFDPNLSVERNQVVLLTSRDKGKTWLYRQMFHFEQKYATAAEAWIIELSDGRLVGTCWKINQKDGSDFPNPYTISFDDGNTWTPSKSTGIMGQSTALAPLPDGRLLFIYNQRKHPPYGVRLAIANPCDVDFGIDTDEIVYSVEKPATRFSATSHDDWTNFSFGEPHVILLGYRILLVVFWCIEQGVGGIRYVCLEAPGLF